MGGVSLIVERMVVAVCTILSFTAVVMSGHLNSSSASIIGPLVGAVAVYVSGGHIGQVVQGQPATPPPPPPIPPK